MNKIFINNFNIIINILPNYLSYKYLFILLMSSKYNYNHKLPNNILNKIYFTPKTYNNLSQAVNLWKIDRNKCIIKYGDISRWNTMHITKMIFLFYDYRNFNDNIDDWILYNVKDSRYMFYNNNKTNQSIKYIKLK